WELLTAKTTTLREQNTASAPSRSRLLGGRNTCFIPRQGHEREVESIKMIFEIENLRETGAGKCLLIPVAVGPLRGKQIIHAGPNRRTVGLAGGQQGQERPCGL